MNAPNERAAIAVHVEAAESTQEGFYLTLFPDGKSPQVVFLRPNQLAHLIDLSRWFLGDLALAYAAAPTLFWNIPVDDNCFMALRGQDGHGALNHRVPHA